MYEAQIEYIDQGYVNKRKKRKKLQRMKHLHHRKSLTTYLNMEQTK